MLSDYSILTDAWRAPPLAAATGQLGSCSQIAAHTTFLQQMFSGLRAHARLRWAQGGAASDQANAPFCLARSGVGSRYSMGRWVLKWLEQGGLGGALKCTRTGVLGKAEVLGDGCRNSHHSPPCTQDLHKLSRGSALPTRGFVGHRGTLFFLHRVTKQIEHIDLICKRISSFVSNQDPLEPQWVGAEGPWSGAMGSFPSPPI